MSTPIRPLYGRPGSRLFAWLAVSAIAAHLLGCGSSDVASSDANPTSSDPIPVTTQAACAPEVGGLVPANLVPIEVQCPGGYTQRKSLAALPIAGRFTSLEELTDAFCVSKSTQATATLEPRAPSFDPQVDFAANDVVTYAFDLQAGTPAMYTRGDDLWLKVLTDTCGGTAPRLGSIAFVIPKEKKVNEQTCARSCE